MLSLLLAASLGVGLDLGTFQRSSAEHPVLLELPPVVSPTALKFVVVDQPEPVDDGRTTSSPTGILIVDRPEPATTQMDPPEPRIRYLHNGEEIDAQEFYRRLNRQR